MPLHLHCNMYKLSWPTHYDSAMMNRLKTSYNTISVTSRICCQGNAADGSHSALCRCNRQAEPWTQDCLPDTSCGCPTRFNGVRDNTLALYSSSCSTCWANGVSIYQGDTALTWMPSGPHSQHRFLVNWFMAAAWTQPTGLIWWSLTTDEVAIHDEHMMLLTMCYGLVANHCTGSAHCTLMCTNVQ